MDFPFIKLLQYATIIFSVYQIATQLKEKRRMVSKVAKSFAQKKPRTTKEIDQEYQNHALNAGHKAALAQKLLKEVEQHHEIMHSLSKEATKMVKVKPTPEASAPIPPSTQDEAAKADSLTTGQEHA
jgi:hypothetical protein